MVIIVKKNNTNQDNLDLDQLNVSEKLTIPSLTTAQASNLTNADIYYNTTTNTFNTIVNGSDQQIVTSGGGSGFNIPDGQAYQINSVNALERGELTLHDTSYTLAWNWKYNNGDNSLELNYNSSAEDSKLYIKHDNPGGPLVGIGHNFTNPTSILHLHSASPNLQLDAQVGNATLTLSSPTNSVIAMGSIFEIKTQSGSGDLDILGTSSQNVVKITATGDNILSVGRGLGPALTRVVAQFSSGLDESHTLLLPSVSALGESLFSSAASSPSYDGAIWYNNTINELRCYINGTIYDIHHGGTSDITHVNTSDASSQLVGKDDTLTLTNKSITIDPDGSQLIEANNVAIPVIKASAGTILAGRAVYVTGFNVGRNLPQVEPARADSASTMPAFITKTTITNTTAGLVLQTGALVGVIDTSSWSIGDPLFVSDTVAGGIQNTRPTGPGVQIQKIGFVIRSNPSNGAIGLVGAGRTNALSQLDGQNHIFLGDANSTPVSTAMSTAIANNNGVTTNTAQTITAKKTHSADIDLTTGTVLKFRNDLPTSDIFGLHYDGGGSPFCLREFTSYDITNARCHEYGYYLNNDKTQTWTEKFAIKYTGLGSASLALDGNNIFDSSTTLSSGVVNSSLTSLGTLTSLSVSGGLSTMQHNTGGDIFNMLTLKNSKSSPASSVGLQLQANNGAANYLKSLFLDGYAGASVSDGCIGFYNNTDAQTMWYCNNITQGVPGAYFTNVVGNSEIRINGVKVIDGNSLGSSITSAPGLSLSAGGSPFVVETTSATDSILRLSMNSGASTWDIRADTGGTMHVILDPSTSNLKVMDVGSSVCDFSPSGYTINIAGTQVLKPRRTGWATATGTATRSTFATSTVTLQGLAERVKALIDDLHSSSGGHGLIGL